MAELVPKRYRLRMAQKELLAQWYVAGILTAVLAVGAIVYTCTWHHQQSKTYASLQANYQQKSSMIMRSQDLRARRQDLASRMLQVQQLMDDKTFVTLLRNISESFDTSDTLDSVSIETLGDKSSNRDAYVVNVHGITANSTTLAQLMTRITHRSSDTMNVVLQSTSREASLEMHPMRFHIRCENAAAKGT